jgi:8-oxo-dGTP pyrophosphatase MutT (NUDIX family)
LFVGLTMPAERSAGVLLYRVGLRQEEPEFLLLDYGRFWDYPKGHVEKGEDDRTAALRELKEETGIAQVELHDGFRHEMTYFFRDTKRGVIRKTVVFFLGRANHEAQLTPSHEHVGGGFLPYEAALERVTYKSAKDALRAAKAFLDSPASPSR